MGSIPLLVLAADPVEACKNGAFRKELLYPITIVMTGVLSTFVATSLIFMPVLPN